MKGYEGLFRAISGSGPSSVVIVLAVAVTVAVVVDDVVVVVVVVVVVATCPGWLFLPGVCSCPVSIGTLARHL